MYKINTTALQWILALIMMSTPVITTAQSSESIHTPELGYDIDIQLAMEKLPAMYQDVAVDIKITSNHSNFNELNIEVQIPEGLYQTKSLRSTKTAPIKPLMVHENNFNFKTLDPGQYKITVKVSGLNDTGAYKDRYAYLKFTVDTDQRNNKLGWNLSTLNTGGDQLSQVERPPIETDSNGLITIYDADENLNEISRQVPESYLDNHSVDAGNTVTINGRYQFRNRENTFYIGYYHNLMRLINASTGEHLDWTYSDDNGNFIFSPVVNPGSDGMRVRAYSVRYQTGQGYGVCGYPDCEDNAAADGATFESFYYRESATFTTGDGQQDVGTYTSGYSLSNSLRALWIKNDMDEAHIHVGLNTSITGSITAEWAADNDDHGNHYHRDANIHFKADVGDGTNETILHEIGHNVMWNAGTFPEDSDCPSPHFINQISGVQCAWTEGWAYAFANFVNDQPKLCLPPSITNCIDFEVHPSFTYCQGWYCGPNSEQVEGHVIGAIWDLYDNDGDDFDIETYNRSLIYNILENDTNDSFDSFWNSWLNDGNSDLGLNSLFQNDIIYGDPYDIRVNNPSVDDSTPQVDQDITVTVNLRNLGEISSVATNIKFYLSTNSTISGLDQLMATNFGGVLDKNLAIFISETFPIDTVGIYYVGACFDDVYGFDPVPSNNCSTGEPINVGPDDVIFENSFE